MLCMLCCACYALHAVPLQAAATMLGILAEGSPAAPAGQHVLSTQASYQISVHNHQFLRSVINISRGRMYMQMARGFRSVTRVRFSLHDQSVISWCCRLLNVIQVKSGCNLGLD